MTATDNNSNAIKIDANATYSGLYRALQAYHMDPGLAMHRTLEALILQGLKPQSPVLEIGCGDGSFATLAFHKLDINGEFIACDYDLNDLNKAGSDTPYTSIVHADATRLPFDDNRFSSVICNSVLTHIHELDACLAEISRVLQPNGCLYASIPSVHFFNFFGPCRILRSIKMHALSKRLEDSYNKDWQQRHFLDQDSWTAHLKKQNLKLESWTEYMGARASLVWSNLFFINRIGFWRLRCGAVARILFPRDSARANWINRKIANRLTPYLDIGAPGGSVYFRARVNKT